MLDAKNENRVKLISKADVNFNTVIIYVDLFNYFLNLTIFYEQLLKR